MNKVKLTWRTEDEKKFISCDLIDEKIEIDEGNKEVKNCKLFFQEIIYSMFSKNDVKEIELEKSDMEISEVKDIVAELINVCNEKINSELQNIEK